MNIALRAPDAAARALLRDACGETHARLDQCLSVVDFDDRRAYADLLSRLSGPVSALEAALEDVGPFIVPDFAGRMRSAALFGDLRDLGGGFCSRGLDSFDDHATALGALYVLEGSRLGGRVLGRRAAESADPDVRDATRFFRHADKAGHWQTFLTALENSPAVRAHPARAIGGALTAFGLFEAAFV